MKTFGRKLARYSKISLTVVFTSLVLSGLLYQIYQLSNIYFSYAISTKVDISLPQKFDSSAISVCLRYSDVLDFDRLSKEEGRSNWSYSTEDETIRFYQDNLAINELFNYTPSEYSVFEKIVFRRNTSYKLYEYNASELHDYFTVWKKLYLEYVCYSIFKIDGRDQSMTYASLAITPFESGLIYDITLSDVIKRVDYLKIVLHNPKSNPYRSLRVSPLLRRYYDDASGLSKYSYFMVYRTFFLINNLPPPFETQCFEYRSIGYLTEAMCVEECLNKQIYGKLNQVPFSHITNDSSLTTHMVSYNKVLIGNTTQVLFDAEEYCMKVKCKWRPCWEASSSTKIEEMGGEKFRVKLVLPQEPNETIDVVAQMVFGDFFTFTTSIIATYTGLSAIALNPLIICRQIITTTMSHWTNYKSQALRSNRIRPITTSKKSFSLGKRKNIWMQYKNNIASYHKNNSLLTNLSSEIHKQTAVMETIVTRVIALDSINHWSRS